MPALVTRPSSPTGPASPSRGDLITALGVALVALAFQLPFFNLWFSQMDEGHMLQFSQIVAEGGQLYRDATLYPLPGAFWLLALVFRIFEPGMLVARWVVVIEFALFCALAFLLVRPLVTRVGAAMLVLLLCLYRIWTFAHWQVYSYSTTALLIQLAMMVVLLRFFASGDRRALSLAGLVYGLGVLCKQDYGAAFLLAVLLTLSVYAARARVSILGVVARFLGPAVLVGAAAGLYFQYHGTLLDVFQFTVWNHFVGMSTFAYSTFPSLFPLLAQDPALRDGSGVMAYMPAIMFNADWERLRDHPLYVNTVAYDLAIKLFYYGPPVFYLAGGVRLWLRRGVQVGAEAVRYLREFLIWSVGSALLLLVWLNRPQDYVHLAVLTWPLPCLGVIYAFDPLRGLRYSKARAVVLALPLIGIVAYSVHLIVRMREVFDTPIPVARAAGILARPEDARLLGDVVEYIQERTGPKETVPVIPYFPLVNFLANRRAPHASSYIVWPFPEYPDRDERVIQAMEATKTNTAIFHFNDFPMFPPVEAYAPRLFAYLVDNFEIERVFNDAQWGLTMVGLRRRAGPEPGVPLLGPGEAAQAVRVEDKSGGALPGPEGTVLVARERWPFRSVLTVRAIRDGRTVVSIPAEVPRGSHLLTAIAIHPRFWQVYPGAAVDASIDIVLDGKREHLFERTLDPQRKIEDRAWFEVDVPLERYAGRRVQFEFSASTPDGEGEDVTRVGFGEPRLVVSTRVAEP